MILFHPQQTDWSHLDPESREIVLGLIEFFESKGKTQLKADDHERLWYQDFLDAQRELGLFAKFLTPEAYGQDGARWDTTRIDAVNEVLGFYGLAYWYTWQVSILGLGPIWMSENEDAKQRAAQFLRDGEVFAFGLSEKTHGADIYSSDMVMTPTGDGGYVANGGKYYIGNGNAARMNSTFGLQPDGEYVFFSADSQRDDYEVVKNVINSQSYVAHYELHDYAVAPTDVLHEGKDAWYAALNTVNIGKYNLGWASIGICTHSLYEAVTHAANRNLYGSWVTDFPHVQRLLSDAYVRLTAMKMFASRAEDYFRTASADDRRYLLFNPLVKMKVTMEGERVMDALWDVIAAKGFEKDMYFEMAVRDIRALPKLEGTVHVNLALALKFLPQYLFNPGEYPEIPTVNDARNDDFLFAQGPAKGLGRIQFHDWREAFVGWDQPNVVLFTEQVEAFADLLTTAPPSEEQAKDLDLLLSVGQLFSMVPYAQLILEQAKILDVDPDLIDRMFAVFVQDFSAYALELHGRSGASEAQATGALALMRRPAADAARDEKIFKTVHALSGSYEMRA
ncbi:MAG: acyl-CoA dehydrogenase [Glaciecola sp.]